MGPKQFSLNDNDSRPAPMLKKNNYSMVESCKLQSQTPKSNFGQFNQSYHLPQKTLLKAKDRMEMSHNLTHIKNQKENVKMALNKTLIERERVEEPRNKVDDASYANRLRKAYSTQFFNLSNQHF